MGRRRRVGRKVKRNRKQGVELKWNLNRMNRISRIFIDLFKF